MTVTIDSARLSTALQSLGRELSDPSEALTDIGRELADKIRARLGRGIQYDGAAMKPLKVRQGVPLNDTRQHIYNRITSQLLGRDTVAVGMFENVPIGVTHQFGSTKKRIPARPFLPIDESGNADLPQEWESDLIETIKSALAESIKT